MSDLTMNRKLVDLYLISKETKILKRPTSFGRSARLSVENLKFLAFAVPCCMALSGFESGAILAFPMAFLILIKVCK